jgi:hypothetical protein
VTREVEWDDSMRARAMHLQERKDATNKFGIPLSEAYKDQPFDVKHMTDFSERAVTRHDAAERKKAESKNGGTLPDNYGAGVHYYAVLPDPSELREDHSGDRP